jgi:hypothetical protein
VPVVSKPVRSPFATRRSAGRNRCAITRAAAPSGRLTRKIARQPIHAIRRPPSEGPSAVPTADIVPRSPIAAPVLSFATVSPTNAIVSASMTAAPRPCSARAATSIQSVGARPHRAEAAVNTMMPALSSLLRPATSPSRPTLTTSVVVAMRYARTTHWTAWNGAWNALASDGSATLAMLVPRDDRSIDSERLAIAHRSEGRRSAAPVAAASRLSLFAFITSPLLSAPEAELRSRWGLVAYGGRRMICTL